MNTGIGMKDLISRLRAEGHKNAQRYRIQYGIDSGNLTRPVLDSSLRFIFSEKNLQEIREYLRNVPQPGRKKQETVTT